MTTAKQSLLNQIKKVEANSKKTRLSQLYGIDALLKEILGLPKFFPVDRITYLNHGIPIAFNFCLNIARRDKPNDIYFVHTKAQEQLATKTSNNQLKAYTLGDIFMHYRRYKGWEQNNDAIGTLAFPCHSTNYLESVADWDRYALSLVNLPEKYQPVKVCMYWRDLLKGKDKSFEKYGLEVVSAGHYLDPMFCENLYRLLQAVKYTTSNEIGSYVFYSLDLDIPFFLMGDKVSFEISNNKSTPRGNPAFVEKMNKIEEVFRVDNLEEDITIKPKHIDVFKAHVQYPYEAIDAKEVKSLLYRNLIPVILKKIKAQLF